MRRYIEVFRNRTFPLLTIVLLLALTAGYYLFYVRGREAYFTHRYVRLLAFESRRIEERLSTLDQVFANYEKDETLTAGDLKGPPGVERLDARPPGFEIADLGVTREGRIEGDRFWIYAGWKQWKAEQDEKVDIVYRFDPFKLAQPDLPEDFDSLFVARRDGTVLFQRSKNEGRELWIVNVRKLIAKDGKELDLGAFANSTSQIDVQLAGESYKLFLRPCCGGIWEPSREPSPRGVDGQRIELVVRTASADLAQPSIPPALAKPPSARDSLQWVVGGLVRSSTLTRQAWAISFTVGIGLIALVVLALLCLPFLRILAMGREEKLRVADALWVGFTAIVGTGLLTVLLLDLHAYRALIADKDARLKRLGDQIAGNLEQELADARSQLGRFNDQVVAEVGPALATTKKCDGIVRYPRRKTTGLLQPREEFVWKRYPFPAGAYTDFERFTWTDAEGRQCFKWSMGDVDDPLVNDVTERHYFREAMAGREAIEPIFSHASGRRVVVISNPVGTSGHRPAFIGVLGIEMSSLNWPVLPPGYGFAVVDGKGEALFHSDPGRAGYENFFEETDNDRGLRAAVYARRSGPLNAPYLGRGHRLHVRPISLGPQTSSWALIVFGDKREMRTFNVDVVTTATLFLILHLLAYMIGCWVLRAANRRYRAGWMWPEKRGEPRAKVHLGLAVFYLLSLLASSAALNLLDGVDLLWFAFVFPWAVLIVSYRLSVPDIPAMRRILLGIGVAFALSLIYLSPGSERPWTLNLLAASREQEIIFLSLLSLGLWGCFSFGPAAPRIKADPPRAVYVAAASLLLALTAAMPAAAFFCIAHQAHLETRIKRGQLELALAYERRQERVKKTYAGFEAKDTALEPLRRMEESRLERRWDLYHDFYFNTLWNSLSQEGAPDLRPQPQIAQAALLRPDPVCRVESHAESRLLPRFMQEVLPLYTDDFIKVRRLIEDEDQSGDPAWRWRRPEEGTLELERGSPATFRLSSQVLPVSLRGFPLLWPFSFLLLAGTIVGLARFVARKLFLFGLPTPEAVDPTSIASASAQNLVLVSPRTDDIAQRLTGPGVAVIDLGKVASREDLLECLSRPDLVTSRRVYLHHFEYRLQDEGHNLLKLELIEELILGRDKPVVILSHVVPAWYVLNRRPAPTVEDSALDPDKAAKRLEAVEKARKEVQERWRNLLRRSMVWVCSGRADAARLDSDLCSIRQEQEASQPGFLDRRLARLIDLAREECGESEVLQGLAGDLVRARLHDLSRDLFLDDLRERAEPHYRTLWAMCTEAEKVVLVHLAEGGLVNAKNAGALKMLMRRGLVKRDPCLRLMNESFRRFVAADVCLDEVRTLERRAEASTWGRIRGPFAVVLIGTAAFFFITQREIFDVSMAFFSALAASLPALFRVFGAATTAQGKAAA